MEKKAVFFFDRPSSVSSSARQCGIGDICVAAAAATTSADTRKAAGSRWLWTAAVIVLPGCGEKGMNEWMKVWDSLSLGGATTTTLKAVWSGAMMGERSFCFDIVPVCSSVWFPDSFDSPSPVSRLLVSSSNRSRFQARIVFENLMAPRRWKNESQKQTRGVLNENRKRSVTLMPAATAKDNCDGKKEKKG